MSVIRQSYDNVSFSALALMLTIILLSLYEAGFDHSIIYWVLLPLLVISILLVNYDQVGLYLSYKKPFFWYLLFLSWAAISIIWSLNPHRTLVEFLQLTLYGQVILLAASLNESNIFKVCRIALIAGFLVALFGISQYMFLDSSRIESTLVNANTMGIFMVMLFLIGWGYYLRQPSRFFGVACITLLVALIFTVSRGSYISLAISFPLLLIGLTKSNIKPALVKTGICLAIALIISQVIVYTAPIIQDIVGKDNALTYILTSRSAFVAWSGVSRFAFWETGARVAINHPFTGTGLGTFFLAYFTEYVDNIWYARYVHNHYIQVAAELGFTGLILFMSFLVRTFQVAWLQIKSNLYPPIYPGIIASAAAFLIHVGGDFSWNFPATTVIFFFCTGSILAVARYNGQHKPNNTKIKIVYLAVALFLITITAWQLTANLFYRQGIILESEDKTYEAAQVYDRANSIYPINSMAFAFAANTYYKMSIEQEDQDLLFEAIQRAEKAVELSPVDGNLHNQLGRLQWQVGNLEKAEEHLVIAADYAAYRLGMFVDLAWFYIQQQRFREADKVVEKGLNLRNYAAGMHPMDDDRERVANQIDALVQMKEIIEDN